jgi:hypothetical protein
MPRDVMSAPTIAFRTERDPGIRAFLIKVAWQRGEIGKRSLFSLKPSISQMKESGKKLSTV